ncbi:MAG: hypothetical protein R3C18_22205 [Planctomycetaceae bacterium]
MDLRGPTVHGVCRENLAAATILTDLFDAAYDGVMHCDRAKMYWQLGRLQWCWANLKRMSRL